MRDILKFVLMIFTILLIPVFVVVYFFYGFRIWCWYFSNRPPIDGEWSIVIPNELRRLDKRSGHKNIDVKKLQEK